MILSHAKTGDIVIGLGAGDVSQYMKKLPEDMEKLP